VFNGQQLAVLAKMMAPWGESLKSVNSKVENYSEFALL
jgi:hypothetical protein